MNAEQFSRLDMYKIGFFFMIFMFIFAFTFYLVQKEAYFQLCEATCQKLNLGEPRSNGLKCECIADIQNGNIIAPLNLSVLPEP